jgi:ligand-binding SRPBCC domain-containing protein
MWKMKPYLLQTRQFLPIPLKTAWDFFSSPANLAKITPARMNFQILSMTGGQSMHPGQIINYKVSVLPLLRVRWMTEITNVQEPFEFTDEQKSGPYKLWRHTHRFKEVEGGVEMSDTVEYVLPLGLLGQLAHALLVKREVNAIFEHRFRVLQDRNTFSR